MTQTKRRTGQDYAWEASKDYKCKGCGARVVAHNGRVRVPHSPTCEIWVRLVLTHPGFSRTLELYRSYSYR